MQNFLAPPHARISDSALTKAILCAGVCLLSNDISFRCMLFWEFLFVGGLISFCESLTNFPFFSIDFSRGFYSPKNYDCFSMFFCELDFEVVTLGGLKSS